MLIGVFLFRLWGIDLRSRRCCSEFLAYRAELIVLFWGKGFGDALGIDSAPEAI